MKGAPALPSSLAEGADYRGIAVVGLAAVMLVALWLAGYGAGDGMLGFPLDDAWIHMVYGRGLAADGTFTYNPGTPSTGATSLLWACVLGGLHLLFGAASVGTIVVASFVVNGALFLV
ncbi:MAG: hypothetical protein QF893_24950, partial [Alphaproteobacteria bacterium]|nr:hypothetical protein [Alphaproteobacteria bacterium]